MLKIEKSIIVLVSCLSLALPAWSATYVLPPADVDLIGTMQTTTARHEDTLLHVARRFNLGQEEILLANPRVDRWLPGEGTPVLLPTRFILPNAPRNGIVLNVPEMRLYYYPPAKDGEPRKVITHPVSIGRMDWSTPLGTTRVAAKQVDPVWRPPQSIKEEHAAHGDILPDVVPAGPDNPLGKYAFKLDLPSYLIHSTNKPFGIGMRVTHGCVRMYPEDIEKLFGHVEVGTPLHIVKQTIKVGWFADMLFIEVHPPLEEDKLTYHDTVGMALDLIARLNPARVPVVDGYALKNAITEKSGYPVPISKGSQNIASIAAD